MTPDGRAGQPVPLTGQFQALSQSLAPQVIENYGGALNLLNRNTGAFGQTAHAVTGLTNDWIAKIDLWNQHQNAMGTILHNGVGFLQQFGDILGHVGIALSNLLKADPGTAHFLLDIVDGAAKLLDWVTKLPAPLLAAAFGLHSMFIWGNVFSGALGAIIKNIPGLSKVSDILSKGFTVKALANPLAWVAVAAAGVGYLAYEMTQASKTARDYVASVDAGLASATASQGILLAASDIKGLNTQIAGAVSSLGPLKQTMQGNSTSAQAAGRAWADAGRTLVTATDPVSGVARVFGDAGKAVGDFVAGLPGLAKAPVAFAHVGNSIDLYKQKIASLAGNQAAVYAEIGQLITGNNKLGIGNLSLAQSFAVLDLAGVKVGDSLPLIQQKVQNLVTGYANLTGSGGALTASLNAITFASLQQQSNVSQLNSAWDTFISTITGGESSFASFEQQVTGMYQAAQSAGVTLRDSNGKISTSFGTLGKAAGSVQGSFTGLNSTSLGLVQTFQQSLTGANDYLDKLTLLASASGGGTDATNLLTRANRDLIAQLLPAAQGSQTLTTELYALAQRGGYTGADSFQALSKWVGNTKQPMSDLNSITTTLTVSAGNLTTDVKNLSTALGTTLNDAMAQVILTESGGLKPMEDLYKAITTTGLNSQTTKTDAFNLADQFYKLTGNVSSAHDEFITFAEKALGLTKSQADTLWQTTLPKLQSTIDGLHGKTVGVDVVLNGSGGILASVSGGQATLQGANGRLTLGGAAAGALITAGTGPTADDVLIRASKGETIVSAATSKKLAPVFAAYRVPGYAAGGVAGLGAAPGWAGGRGSAFASEAGTAFARAAVAAFKKAAATPQGFTPGAPGYGGSIAAEQQFAASQFSRFGWSVPYEMPALIALWNQESGWNPNIVNPNGGAYGIPQALPGVWGHPYALGDYKNQILWGLNYIKTRWGDPIAAEANELAAHWYSKGGKVRKFANGGVIDEPVFGWGARSGQRYSFGERGRETVTPGGGGTPVFNITINAPSGNARDIGSVIVGYIRAYTRAGGTLFPAGVRH